MADIIYTGPPVVIYSESQPSDATIFDHSAPNGTIEYTFTAEITANKNVQLWFRYDSDKYWIVTAGWSDGELRLKYYDGTYHDLDGNTGYLTDGVQYKITINFAGEDVEVLLDDVPTLSGSADFQTDKTVARIYHNLVTNDIELESRTAGGIPEFTLEGINFGASQVYYVRADGTAATKAAAIGPSSTQSACMDRTVYLNATFTPGDTILFSDKGGRYYGYFYTASDGDSSAPITHANVPGESPVITGARLITGWTVYSGNIYRAARSAYTASLFYDDAVGTPRSSIVACVADGDWYHDGSAYLYFYSSGGDPDAIYTDPGIEVSHDDRAFIPQNDYLVIDGLTVSKATYAGIASNNPGSHLIIRNCVLEYNHDSSGLMFGVQSGAAYTDILIEDNIARYNGECGIAPQYNGTNIIVRRNECYGNGKLVGFQGTYPAGIKCFDEVTFGMEGLDIYDNVCYDNGRNYEGDNPGRGCGIWFDNLHPPTPTRNKIHHNLIYDNAGCGIFVEITDDSDVYNNVGWGNGLIDTWGDMNAAASIRVDNREQFTCERNRVYNNTFVGGYQGLAVTSYSVHVNGSLSDNLIKNNIFIGAVTFNAYMRYGGDNDGTYGSGNVYSANCFDAEANDFIEWGGVKYDTYDAWLAASSQTDNNVEADPLFFNAGADQYWLADGSPCIDSGVNLGATYEDALQQGSVWPDSVSTAKQGLFGSGWEIGAYNHPMAGVVGESSRHSRWLHLLTRRQRGLRT